MFSMNNYCNGHNEVRPIRSSAVVQIFQACIFKHNSNSAHFKTLPTVSQLVLSALFGNLNLVFKLHVGDCETCVS